MHDPVRASSTVALLTGMTPPDHGRDRLLIIAIDLFYRHGFRGVDLPMITAEAGITEAEFRHHFQNLDDLIVQAIYQHDRWERAAWVRAVEELAPGDPKGQLLALWDVMDNVFKNEAYHGCLFINAAGEFPDTVHPANRAAMAHKREARKWVTQLARRAHIPDPERFAYEYITLFEGALILRQVHHDPEAATMTRPMVERLIQHALASDSR